MHPQNFLPKASEALRSAPDSRFCRGECFTAAKVSKGDGEYRRDKGGVHNVKTAARNSKMMGLKHQQKETHHGGSLALTRSFS